MGVNLFGRSRIHRQKLGIKPLRPARFCGFLLQLLPDFLLLFIRLLGKIDAVKQRLDIKARAAHQDRQPSLRVDLPQRFCCHFLKNGDIIIHGGINDINQMMRDALHFRLRDLGGADVQSPVDLNGVRRDTFAVQCLGELDRNGCFSHCRGTRQNHQGTFFLHAILLLLIRCA